MGFNSELINYFSDPSGVLLLASLMRASTLFSTKAGRSQNLSDVRSEACAVDGFSYYLEYSFLGDDIT